MNRWPARWLLVAALTGGACSPPHRLAHPLVPSGVASASPAGVYVSIGGAESRGAGSDNPLRESWTQDLFRVLPAGFTFVNVAVPGATAEQALATELPLAQTLHPTLVTVQLTTDDLLEGMPTARYRGALATLIGALRASGATVLVANAEPVDQLPAYLSCTAPAAPPGSCPSSWPSPTPGPAALRAAVTADNAALADVVRAAGAVLVDLHAAALSAAAHGLWTSSLISDDGFSPSDAGHQVIADQFAAALRATGTVPVATEPAA